MDAVSFERRRVMNMLFRSDNLEDLRERFERAWDESTSFGRRRDVAKGRPEGQCYATSRVLKNIYGGRVILGSVGALHDHCWLELEFSDIIVRNVKDENGNPADAVEAIKIILDMTADQRGIDKEPVVWGLYEPHPESQLLGNYRVYSDYKPRREVEDEEAATRLGGRAFAAYERLIQKIKETSAG